MKMKYTLKTAGQNDSIHSLSACAMETPSIPELLFTSLVATLRGGATNAQPAAATVAATATGMS